MRLEVCAAETVHLREILVMPQRNTVSCAGHSMKLAVPSRRFPPPWTVEELEACFVVRDHDGQQLAYVYFEDEPGRRSAAQAAQQR